MNLIASNRCVPYWVLLCSSLGLGFSELFVQPIQAPGQQGSEGVPQDRVPGLDLFGLPDARAPQMDGHHFPGGAQDEAWAMSLVLILMVQLFEKSKKVSIASALDFFLSPPPPPSRPSPCCCSPGSGPRAGPAVKGHQMDLPEARPSRGQGGLQREDKQNRGGVS